MSEVSFKTINNIVSIQDEFTNLCKKTKDPKDKKRYLNLSMVFGALSELIPLEKEMELINMEKLNEYGVISQARNATKIFFDSHS